MKKNDKTIATVNDCPPFENLSGFFDDAVELSAAETKHLVNCPACAQRLVEFRVLELTLKHQLTAATPKHLIKNIKASVHRELAANNQPTHHFRPFLKIAAAFAIISFAFFYGNIFFRPAQFKTTSKSIYPTQTTTNETKQANEPTPYYNNQQPGFWPNTITENSIPLDNIIGANYGGIRQPVFQINNLPDAKNAPVRIANSVHQVWITPTPEVAVNKINTILKQLKISPANSKIVECNGQFDGTIKLTKMHLVKFVRQCKQAGLDLLSPQAPQPEQNRFSGIPTTTVNYSFTITTLEQ
jgi:hypothetical protein